MSVSTCTTAWTNPYNELQHSLRQALRSRLRRTNGYVSIDQFMECVQPGCASKAGQLRLRLFKVHVDGKMEWKPEIVSEALLAQKVGGSAAIDMDRLTTLWAHSRRLSLRTPFPSLAPAGNKSQHVGRHSFSHAPVFGVDVLVRPPTEFAEERADSATRNSLQLGEEAIALVIHGNFADGRLVEDGQYFARLVVGNAFGIPKIASLISPAAGSCEHAMRASLRAGDPEGVMDSALPRLHTFAHDAAMAFVC